METTTGEREYRNRFMQMHIFWDRFDGVALLIHVITPGNAAHETIVNNAVPGKFMNSIEFDMPPPCSFSSLTIMCKGPLAQPPPSTLR